jgi:hypothetical protein
LAAEIEEICVAHDSLSFEDYLECRRMHLIVTLFYNDSLFGTILKFLRNQNLSIWKWIELLLKSSSPERLKKLFAAFRQATIDELWTDKAALERFILEPGVVQQFVDGRLGNNLLFVHKTQAIVGHSAELAAFARQTVHALLKQEGAATCEALAFVDEAVEFHRLSMSNMFAGSEALFENTFTYDIASFAVDQKTQPPSFYRLPAPTSVRFVHDEGQRAIIARYLNIYGKSDVGIGRILSKVHTKKLFRHAVRDETVVPGGGEGELRYQAAGLQN